MSSRTAVRSLNTCVIVAAIKSSGGASHILVELASTGKIETVLTVPLLHQYEDVLYRVEHRVAGWTDKDLAELIDSLLESAERVHINFSYRPTLRDEGDELVLEAAINGQADIVTFNVRDFAPASRFGVRVLRPGELLRDIYEEGGLLYGEK
jgi:putative PIN family toxin of toxin-antitoxin system